MDNTSYLQIENLTKIYNNIPVLDNLNLRLNRFEKLGIIGLSGSGKSTLLKLIFGLLNKDGGQVYLENDKVKDRSEVLVPGDDRVKYVRQNYELFPDHTVFENIEHHIRFHTKEYINKRIYKLLKAFDIEGVANVKSKLISGGEQQRVAICCSLAQSPKLLLLDEPMAHLDPINARQIKTYLWNFINKEKITTIFVTHSSEDALAYASKIAVIHKGKIVELGSPMDLYNTPKKKVTAQLLGLVGKVSGLFLEGLKDTKKYYFVRPEHVILVEKGIPFDVSEVKYLGVNYILTLKKEKNILYVYSNIFIEAGEKVSVFVDATKLISCT